MAALVAAAMGLADLLTYFDQYLVPEYQRVYGWGEVEIKRLFSDVECAMRPGAPHFFLGTIYLAAAKDARVAQIADGQQRMLTAMMAYAIARDLCTEPEAAARHKAVVAGPAPGRYRLVPRERDAPFFAQWVQEPGATLKPFVREGAASPGVEDAAEDPESALSESQRNIITNRDLMLRLMRKLDPASLARLFDFLARETSVVVITAPTLEDARNAYASTQTRGLRQSETDKLKVELIADCPVALRARLAGQWEECEAILGREDLAELLQHMIVMRVERKAQHAIEVDLFRAFNLPDDVERFITLELVPSASAYRQLCKAQFPGRGAMRRIRGHVVTLLRTTHDAWKAPALQALRQFGSDPAALENVLRRLERLASVLMIRGTDPNQMLERYVAVIREMKARQSPAIQALELTNAERAEARNLLLESKFGTRERFRMPLLLKLNDLFADEVQHIDPKTVSCEHIVPRNAPPGSPWRMTFRRQGGRRYEGGNLVQKLGNLTILSHADNRAADTLPFARKRPILKRSRYPISRDAARRKDWTPEIVEERTLALAKMLAEHWDL